MKSLAIALPLTAAAGFLVGVRAEVPWFAPKVDRIVNYGGTTGAHYGAFSYIVGTVPAGHDLVVSDIFFRVANGSLPNFTLVERDTSGVETTKIPYSFDTSSNPLHFSSSAPGSGFVFQAGTDIVIKCNGPSSWASEMVFTMIGHLTP